MMKTLKLSKLNLSNLSFLIKFQASTTTKSMKKTYYQILQVTSNASMANIKQNYLRLAKIYHPDIYKGKDKTRFQKIQQAYKILIDKSKRNKYDQQIGIKVSSRQASNDSSSQFTSQTEASKDGYSKPKNRMQYESKNEDQIKMDLDEQFEKFFNKKPKTKFQQINLAEEPQIRSMSEAERIRRHFKQTYQSDQKLLKTGFQKQFDSIINDQINQKNKMYQDTIKMEKEYKERHSQKGVKKLKWRLLTFFGILSIVTFPLIYSYATKYRIEKEHEKMVKQQWAESERLAQQISIRYRLKY